MSSLILQTLPITDILPHDNADALELAIFQGWTCVVKKGQFQKGDIVTYFPPELLLPIALGEQLGVTNYLKKMGKNYPDGEKFSGRVSVARLRGVPSYGILVHPPQDWLDHVDTLAEYLGVEKYSPPEEEVSGDAERTNVHFHKYTDMENLKNFPRAFEEGEDVVVTEKIHGRNVRIGLCYENEEMVLMGGSHGVRRRQYDNEERPSLYWKPIELFPQIETMLRDMFQKYQQNIVLFGEIYGCFSYNTPITIADGTKKRIGEIVNNKLSCEVRSFNFETGEVENKKIIGWSRKSSSASDWLTIKFHRRGRGGKEPRLVVTKNHKVYTQNMQEIAAGQLKIGDVLYLQSNNRLSFTQEQIILGSLLGDASLIDKSFSCGHSVTQEEYFFEKKSLLNSLVTREVEKVSGYGSNMKSFSTVSLHNYSTTDLEKLCIHNGRKTVTQEWLSLLSPLALAIWYMDDGTLNTFEGKSDKSCLSTEGFSEEEVDIIIQHFVSQGFECYKVESQKGKYRVVFSPKGTIAFQTVISPYVFPCMKYKLSDVFKNVPCIWKYLETEQKYGLIETHVTEIVEGTPYKKDKMDKYDIEVEDNHTFFANGILVHNSGMQDLQYGEKHVAFRAFDIALNTRYYDHAALMDCLDWYEIPGVPVLYKGPFSWEKMKELVDGKTTLNSANQIREGIVIRPSRETTYNGHQRKILKLISFDYLNRKGGSENH